ncbi:hypothetical protein [Thioclava sp. GXIMD2076]|uniref:Nmad2 family putative nucleotide modification protein n=1 Tax=Thioclava sp. GXIMD2076 TaxID=3131931 RepID=UPI0030CF10A3
MKTLHSYVVRFDSGFAPNPFYGFCTLATCKPSIRRHAAIGDWVVGTGSNRKGVRRGGHLVHAMRVQEVLKFSEYWNDPRFAGKKPNLHSSYRKACGDNIYNPDPGNGSWSQLNSYHSTAEGKPLQKHINRDTSVNRVLISSEFIYFGAEGPLIPVEFRDAGLVHSGIGRKKVSDQNTIEGFENWLAGLGVQGYQGRPYDMIEEARRRK